MMEKANAGPRKEDLIVLTNAGFAEVDPWCKEDALMVLLSATPGKRNYAVSYPTDEDKESLTEDGKMASTIVYRQNIQTKKMGRNNLGVRREMAGYRMPENREHGDGEALYIHEGSGAHGQSGAICKGR